MATSALDLLPHPFPDVIRNEGHGCYLDQEPLRNNPAMRDINRQLRDYAHSLPDGEVCVAWSSQCEEQCFVVLHHQPRLKGAGCIVKLAVPPECDGRTARKKLGMLNPRPLRLEDILDCNERPMTEAEAKRYSEKLDENAAKRRQKAEDEFVDEAAAEYEDAYMRAERGEFDEKTKVGYDARIEAAAEEGRRRALSERAALAEAEMAAHQGHAEGMSQDDVDEMVDAMLSEDDSSMDAPGHDGEGAEEADVTAEELPSDDEAPESGSEEARRLALGLSLAAAVEASGKSSAEWANEIGCSSSTVDRWCRNKDVPPSRFEAVEAAIVKFAEAPSSDKQFDEMWTRHEEKGAAEMAASAQE